MVVYLASDLLWATRIKGTSEALGIQARPVRSMEMLEARLADSPVGGLIVDLEAGEIALELIRRAASGRSALAGETPGGSPPQIPNTETGLRIVAFGPHVAVDRLEAARKAGADSVLARGAFDRQLVEILRSLGGPGNAARAG